MPVPPPALANSEPVRTTGSFRFYPMLMAGFVAVLLCSNLIAAPKRVSVGSITFGAGVLLFPLTYLFGDVLTEVYGYARSRRVVWAGFLAMIFASAVSAIVIQLPADPRWPDQGAYETVFASAPRVALASIVAFFVGELINAYVLARLKVRTEGRWLWLRTIGSTVVGEAADSLIFYPVAFLGVWQGDRLAQVLLTNYALKVLWEVIATPLTYVVVAALKRAEGMDHFDVDTDFNPFTLAI